MLTAGAIAVLVVVDLIPGAARADESVRQTVQNLQQLAAPVARTELRFDLGGLAGVRHLDGRIDVRLEIPPRPDFWYAVGVSSVRTTSVTTTTTTGSNGSQQVTTITQTDGAAVSARLFKRLGVVVLSAGMVDSGAGLTVELRARDDRLRFEILARAPFSDISGTPFLRAGGSAEWHGFYVQAGVQDILDRALVTPYVGLGLRWSDADLLKTAAQVGP